MMADPFVRPQRQLEIAPSLLERLGAEHELVVKLARLRERQADVLASVRRLAGDVQRANAKDRQAAERSLVEDPGRKLPKAGAPAVEAKLAEAQREREAVEAALGHAIRDLLQAGIAFAGDLAADLADRAKALEAEVERLLERAGRAAAEAGRLETEVVWVRALRDAGDVRRAPSFTAAARDTPLLRAVRLAQTEISEARRKAAEREAQLEREERYQAEQAAKASARRQQERQAEEALARSNPAA